MRLRAATVADGYKVGHGPMYADGTTKVYANLTPRSDKIYRRTCTKFYDGLLVFVGAQGAIQEIVEMWQDSFFSQPKEKVIRRYATRMIGYFGSEVEAVNQMAELHDMGFLPLKIKALPEGSKVPMGVPVLTVTNTLPKFYWLTNYLETVLSDLIWKPSTTATIAAEYKAICEHYAEITGTDYFPVSIQCHDFSMRGMSGPEDAARSGFGHLTSFIGSDTLPALDYAEDYYDANPLELIAISVPATEHAVATSNILKIEREISQRVTREYIQDVRLEAEKRFMRDLITRKFPNGIVSYVADSFDFWAVITQILPQLKDVVMARKANGAAPGKLVIRPDSGDPVKVICGYKVLHDVFPTVEAFYKAYEFETRKLQGIGDAEVVNIGGRFYEFAMIDPSRIAVGNEIPAWEVKGAVQCLWEIFGGTITKNGYKLLDDHIGLIYGDSITTKRCNEILEQLCKKGFASGNIVFGVGSYTYQCITRDTFGFAVKATYTEVGEMGIEIFKDPKTDSKKKSAKGLLRVDVQDGQYVLSDCQDSGPDGEGGGELKTIWENGEWVIRTSLEEIRNRLTQ